MIQRQRDRSLLSRICVCTGTLIKGAQGRLVRFTQTNTSIRLNLTARYYDVVSGQWKEADNDANVNAQMHFLLSNGTATETVTDHGATTSVKLIDDQNHTTTFSEEQAQAHLAPSTNDNGQVFDYWDIINTDTGEHIANCCSEKFTFKVWNNYTITPHYTDAPDEITDEGTFITIDYIDTSRNLWGDASYNNDDDTTDRTEVTDKAAADVDRNGLNIVDATLIQRFLVGFDLQYSIGEIVTIG